MFDDLLKYEDPEKAIQNALSQIHREGPTNATLFEKLAHLKKDHPQKFKQYESKLMSLMGLFYKTEAPKSIIEKVYAIYAEAIEEDTGEKFTPIQASAYKHIRTKKYFSFSSPTSSGKSHLFRALIQKTRGDVVIVVPSRALIAEYYFEVIRLVDPSVLVLQFIDSINTEKTKRRVFIITPERGGELFKRIHEFNIELFLLDEAQISEEPVRGLKFDSFIRRIDKVLPKAKKVFAHPFVKNPEAQLIKHGFDKDSASEHYNHHAVGKIFVAFGNNKFEYFSPNVDSKNSLLPGDFVEETIKNNGTLLIYISKSRIYKGGHIDGFSKYIDLCPTIEDPAAKALINKLREYVGVKKDDEEKHSLMLDMMEKGIVIHHGSVPLKARLLIEEFIRSKHARICFATSTLNQGINMPFDIVWIDNFTKMDALTLKNLVGRAGRSTKEIDTFNYGYTIVKKSNVSTFSKRFKETFGLKDMSLLDDDDENIDEDSKDIVEAIKKDSFDDTLHLTQTQIARLSTGAIDEDIKFILDNLLHGESPLTGNAYAELGVVRNKIKDAFKKIYIQHLRRPDLFPGEKSVLSAAIPIMLWRIQGKSFSEIISLRYGFLTDKKTRDGLLKMFVSGEITAEKLVEGIKEIPIRFSQIASPLPNKQIGVISLFPRNASAVGISYDTLIFDTYDYLDKVIALSITDPICAALEIFYQKTNDQRAAILQKYIRYGTKDDVEIWLLRYGFTFEDIEWLKEHVTQIDSAKIVFKESIKTLDIHKLELIERYL